MTPTRRMVRRAAWLLAGVVLSSGLAAPGWAASLTASDGICAEAASLTQLGDPRAAVAAIASARAADPGAAGSARLCAAEYGEAVLRETQAAGVATWAAHVAGDLAGRGSVIVAPPLPALCTGVRVATPAVISRQRAEELVRLAVAEARACDRHVKVAPAAEPTATRTHATLAQSSRSAWQHYRRTRLDPWVPVALAFLAWAALVLVLARLLLVLFGKLLGDQLSGTVWRRPRPVGRVVGWVALVVSGAVAVGPFSLLSIHLGPRLMISVLGLMVGLLVLVGGWLETSARSPARILVVAAGSVLVLAAVVDGAVGSGALLGPLIPHPWWGALAAVVAAVGFALAWGAGPRLSIASDGHVSAPSAEYLGALTRLLGCAPPRGLEVPLGTDADFLATLGILETSTNPWVAAVTRLVRLSRPPTPWRLTVTAHSEDALTASLTRNQRRIVSEMVERGAQFRCLEQVDVTEQPGLAPFPAALAVVSIAVEHGIPDGLAGATRWRSVALQYLGAVRPRGDLTARALFAEAVARDPQNLLAQIGYWHALYREAAAPEDLRRYRALLEDALTGHWLDAEPALRLRALYTRVAVGINLRSVDLGADENLEVRAGDLLGLSAQTPPEGAEVLWADLRLHAGVLVASIPTLPVPDLDAASPEGNGPGVDYLWACYFATNGADTARAVRHLRLADQDPDLALWRTSDPQLAALRGSEDYRREFGEPVPTDILTVPPFRDHAAALRSAGLVNLERLGLAEVSDLVALGVASPAAEWVIQLARFALTIPPDLEDWVVPIVATFAEQGLVAIPADDESLASLRDAILAACEPLRSSPDLDTWL